MLRCLIFLLSLIFAGCVHSEKSLNAPRTPQSENKMPQLILENLKYADRVTLRTGVFPESDTTPFKGCILYLQGLGDSIRNHDPLFRSLSQSGYRVISYDYMEQGGSEGSMNATRLSGRSYKQIGVQARWLWNHRSKTAIHDRNCSSSKKFVLGWSTGGLAAYKLAYEKWADAVALIAPGIRPKLPVGEAATNKAKALHAITERTLTRNRFENTTNPHLDPIKPDSPLKVMAFATDLVITAQFSKRWKIDPSIKGIIFLSGTEDTYVDRNKTLLTLKKNASHFQIISYDGALHELDNEIPEVTQDLQTKTIEFFDRNL